MAKIDKHTAQVFCRLWGAKFPIVWANELERGEYRYPTIEAIAHILGWKPKEVWQFADDLRYEGVRLSTKENESRYAPQAKGRFDYVGFGKLLIQVSYDAACNAYQLSNWEADKHIATMIAYGIKFPPRVSVPEWLLDKARLLLFPHKFTPEERRTIGAKFRVKRPKGKKRYYYNGTGVYRSKGQSGVYRPNKLQRMSKENLKALASLKW